MGITHTFENWTGDTDNTITEIIDQIVLNTCKNWNVNFEYESGHVEENLDGTYAFNFQIYSIGFRSENARLIDAFQKPFEDEFGDDFVSLKTAKESGQKVNDPHADEDYWGYYFTLILSL